MGGTSPHSTSRSRMTRGSSTVTCSPTTGNFVPSGGAVAVLVPVLAGCEAGLNAPTQEYHPASIGTLESHNGITVSNLFVLGPAVHDTLPSGGQAGVFLALSSRRDDQLTSVSAPGT